MSVHVLWTEPLTEIWRKPYGVRWCFVCRKRVMFEDVRKAPTDPMSYYGPSDQIECTNCKTVDGDCFPGSEREWE